MHTFTIVYAYYYKYNILLYIYIGMSIKMTQASKDRVLYASFSVSSLIPQDAVLRVFLIQSEVDYGEPSVRYSSNIKSYNANKHGLISFASYNRYPTLHSTVTTTNSSSNIIYDNSNKPVLPITDRSPHETFPPLYNTSSPPLYNASSPPLYNTSKSLEFSPRYIVHDILPSGTLECVVKWEPPSDLPKEEFIVTSIGISFLLPSCTLLPPPSTTATATANTGVAITDADIASSAHTIAIPTHPTTTHPAYPTIALDTSPPIPIPTHTIPTLDTILYSQVIPMVCFLEHKSSFTVDKYMNFGDVPLTTEKTYKITITNLSPLEELHYLLIPTPIPIVSTTHTLISSIGKVSIMSGQHLTGVLQPSQSKEITMLFTATAIG